MKKRVALAAVGSVSLLALAAALPAQGAARRDRSPPAMSLGDRSVGSFTPAVRDPRLAAALTRRRTPLDLSIRFTPAATPEDRNRSVRVAMRVAPGHRPLERSRPTPAVAPTAASPSLVQITPSSYNLGVSLGWRRFALTGDVASAQSASVASGRESARIGVDYRANRRLTGRLAVAAERSEGLERIVAEDQALSLDVGGSYSLARNLDVTAGARYRVSRDRLEPLARNERLDSQSVYIGTSFRF